MPWFFRRVYRERRRFLVIAILTFAAGAWAFRQNPKMVLGVPFPIFAGLAFMLGLGLFLATLVLVFPKIRSTAESVALSVPVLALMGAFESAPTFGLEPQLKIFGLLFCYLTVTIYSGTWVDRFLPARPMTLRSSARTKLPPQDVWPWLFMTPDTPEPYRDDDLLAVEWIESGQSFRTVWRNGDTAKIEEINTIEALVPGSLARWHWQAADARPGAAGTSGVREIRLSPEGSGSRLETSRTFDGASWRARLFSWIDDGAGRLDDKALVEIEAASRG